MTIGFLVPVDSLGMMTNPQHVGQSDFGTHYVVARHDFWCVDCTMPVDKSLTAGSQCIRIRSQQVGNYSQTCDVCGKLVVDGFKTDGKPLNLFGKDSHAK